MDNPRKTKLYNAKEVIFAIQNHLFQLLEKIPTKKKLLEKILRIILLLYFFILFSCIFIERIKLLVKWIDYAIFGKR